MANWTVSSWSNTETTGDNVTAGSMAAYVDLTITPNTGYVISATDFKIGGATEDTTNSWSNSGGTANLDSEIYKVVFSDIGTAGTVANTVRARVHFAAAATGGSSWSMPSNDDTLYIDIDERTEVTDIDRYVCIASHHTAEASSNNIDKHTITYATAPTGITTSSLTPLGHNAGVVYTICKHRHEGTVTDNPTPPGALIFEVTFAANTLYGYYYVAEPSHVFTSTPDFTIISSGHTYDTSSNLISVVFKCYYTPPSTPDPYANAASMCELGQKVVFQNDIRQIPQGEPGAKKYITFVNVNQNTIQTAGETRDILVAGDIGAVFKLVVTRTADGHTYDFTTDTFTSGATTSTETTIGSGGTKVFPVIFPSVTSNTTYDITIVPTTPTSTLIAVPITAGDLRLYQYPSIVVSLGISDPDGVWGEGTASGDIFHSSENTVMTLTGQAHGIVTTSRAFSYTIKPAMLDAGSGTITPKSTLDFTLDSASAITTDVDGDISSATFDVDTTVGIVADVGIDWAVRKIPLFGLDSTKEITVGKYDPDLSLSDQVSGTNIDNLTVGMVLSASNISSQVTIASIGSDTITLDTPITTNTSIPITFTADGVTVSGVTDVDTAPGTLVASQSLSGLKDNLSLTFGGQDSDVSAYITSGAVTQSSSNVVITGTLNVSSFGTAATTVKIDIKELITIS